ncbi:MAG TPA: DUF1877 family protein [Dehalococcoidia bacterium]|jgi:hypothetical protein|nr:DUF1877 family protein [Dehalococcoidia bacterium]
MSMIMRIARGTEADLERLANGDGRNAAARAALEAQVRRVANMPPELRARLEALLRDNPQMAPRVPHVVAGLQRRLSVVPRSSEHTEDSDGASQQPAAARRAQPEVLDIHKSWHVFHFLFTGRADEGGAPPSSFMLEGGREVGDDLGYGPGRLFDARSTAAVARFLDGLTLSELERRIDAPRMAALGIYCAGEGSRADAEEMRGDVALYFPRLQAHFRAASSAGEATLLQLT